MSELLTDVDHSAAEPEAQTQQLEEALVRLDEAWSQLSRQVAAEIKADLPAIPPAQAVLLRLLDRWGSRRMSDLAALLDVTLSGCTAVVDRTVEAGLVARTRDPEDRRVVWVQLSDQGYETLHAIRQARAHVLAKHLSRLDPAEIRQLAALLGRAAEAAHPVGGPHLPDGLHPEPSRSERTGSR